MTSNISCYPTVNLEDAPKLRFRHHALLMAISAIWLIALTSGYEQALLAQSLLGVLVAIVGLKRPFLGTLGLGMLTTLDPLSRGLLGDAGIWRWNTFNLLLLVIAFVRVNRVVKKATVQHLLLLLFIALLGIDLLVTEDLENGWQQFLGAASAVGFAAYLMKAACTPGIWYSLGIVNGFLGATAGFFYYAQRSDLPYLNPNAFAHSPLTGLFSVCLAYMEARTARDIRILLPLAGVNLVWIFLSGSRGCIFVSFVCLLYMLVRMKAVAGSKSIPAVVFVSAVSIVLVSTFSDLGENAFQRVAKLFDDDRSMANKTSGRSELAFAGWEIFKSHPLGIGTGSFDQAFADLDIEGSPFAGHQKQAHSGWVKILTENGVPGIILLVLFVASFVTGGMRAGATNGVRGIGYLTAAALTIGFLSTEFQSKDLWFLAMSAAAALRFRTQAHRLSRSEQTWHEEAGPKFAST